MGYKDLGLVINQAQAATVNSDALDCGNTSGLSVQTEWTGTVSGAIKLQARNSSSLSWRDVTQVTLAQPSGSAGGEVFEVGNARSRFYRVVYTHASGTGALSVAVHAKGGESI